MFVCKSFASENYKVFNTLKLENMFIPGLRAATFVPPKILPAQYCFEICTKNILEVYYNPEPVG